MKTIRICVFFIFSLFFSHKALSWADHGKLLDVVFQGIENDRQWSNFLNTPAQYEPLENFLKETQDVLPKTLATIESWSITNEPSYRAAPPNLKYIPAECHDTLEICFKKAIRVNPATPLTNYIQDYRDEFPQAGNENLENISLTNIFIKNDLPRLLLHAKKLTNGETLSARQVLTTFVDEPDHGLDINLYDNNPQHFTYGFGTQPIGVDNIPYVSQFLFHVATYQESCVVKLASPRIKESYPAYRAHLYFELARTAQSAGHHYWALRFAAWGLHYVQDLTQPYHSTLFPDYSVAQMMYWFTQNALGFTKNYDQAKNIIANRHTLIETLLAHIMLYKMDTSHIAETALKEIQAYPQFTGTPVSDLMRRQISKETAAAAKKFIASFVKELPQEYISNSNFDVSGFTDYNNLFLSLPEEQSNIILQTYAKRLKYFSLYSQVYLNEILNF